MNRGRAEVLMLAAGLCLAAVAGLRLTERAIYQRNPQLLAPLRRLPARVLGRLEIPRIEFSAPVIEGADEQSLSLSVGHVPETAAIGTRGNTVIAGHRDAEFGCLRKLNVGDRLRLESAKTYVYVVRHIRVVDAGDTSLLQKQDSALLTLVTCYPFHYIGSAPQRYIVQAQLVGS